MKEKKLDEESALAILFANTRRKKRKEDLITIARAFEYLVNLYGSKEAVAKRVGLSTEMIREFLTVLKLPREIQKLVTECAHVTQGIDEREYPDYDSASTSSGDLETDEGNYQFTL